jgi:hypothetical protein
VSGSGTLLDPDGAAAGGRQILNAADIALSKVPHLLAEIRSCEAGKPEGDGPEGRAFGSGYAPSASGLDAAEKIVHVFHELGATVLSAVTCTQDTDEQIAARITRATQV